MPFLEDCVERSTAIAAACGWLALGGGIEATVGVVVGAAGLASAVAAVSRRHGPESHAALKAIRNRISDDLQRLAETERWESAEDIHVADAALERALAGCFLDRRALAESARSPDGFPKSATRIVLTALAEREPVAFGENAPSAARVYAELVVRTALEAAMENEAYFKGLEPLLLMEMLKGIGTLEVKIDAIHQDVRETLAVVRLIQPKKGQSPHSAIEELLNKQNLLLMRQTQSEIAGRVQDRSKALAAAIVQFTDKNKLVHEPSEFHSAPWDALVHVAAFVCNFGALGEKPGWTLTHFIDGAELSSDVTYDTYLELQWLILPATDIWPLIRDAWSLAETPELARDQLDWERSHKVAWLWEQFAVYRALKEKVEAGIVSGSVTANALRRGIVGAFQLPSDELRDYLAAVDDKPWSYETWWPKSSL